MHDVAHDLETCILYSRRSVCRGYRHLYAVYVYSTHTHTHTLLTLTHTTIQQQQHATVHRHDSLCPKQKPKSREIIAIFELYIQNLHITHTSTYIRIIYIYVYVYTKYTQAIGKDLVGVLTTRIRNVKGK